MAIFDFHNNNIIPTVVLTDTSWRTSYYLASMLRKRKCKIVGVKSTIIYGSEKEYDLIVEGALSIELLKKISDINNTSIVVPIKNEDSTFLYGLKESLPKGLRLFKNSDQLFGKLTDKSILCNISESLLGLKSPYTFLLKRDTIEKDGKDLIEKYKKVILKIAKECDAKPKDRIKVADSYEKFIEGYKALSVFNVPVIAQEYINGEIYGINVSTQNNKLLAYYSHKRLFCESGKHGPSLIARTLFLSEHLEIAKKFAKNSGWEGIAMIEIIKKANGVNHLLEINARPWGSIILSDMCNSRLIDTVLWYGLENPSLNLFLQQNNTKRKSRYVFFFKNIIRSIFKRKTSIRSSIFWLLFGFTRGFLRSRILWY